MTVPAKTRYDFKKQLEELQKLSGRATEMVSLYVPPGRQISDAVAYLKDELSQSSNIKSKGTRKNVMAAIESLIGRLKLYKAPPPNGLVLFVGHVSVGKDQTNMVSYVLEPIEPINTYLYRCDSNFYLDPLLDMIADKETYGLIVMDRKEATIGLLRGKHIEALYNRESQVPSKHGMGGQSQRRFERLIEIAANEWFKKVGDKASEIFLQQKELEGIIVGGPGPTKEYFVKEGYLHYEIQKKIMEPLIDVGYTDEYGLRELVDKSRDLLANVRLIQEKKLMERLLQEIVKENGGLAAYGEGEVRDALQKGMVETLLLSEALTKSRVKLRCTNPNCDYEKTVTMNTDDTQAGTCPKCGNPLSIAEKRDIVDDLSELADKIGATVEFISTEFGEGKNLHDAFGGIAALLRYKK